MVFLVYHLYKFDHFRSLRYCARSKTTHKSSQLVCNSWGQQTRSGAFKRVMTFTYLISVPLILSYSVGMAVVKYREGYMALIGYGSEFSCFDKGCGDIF